VIALWIAVALMTLVAIGLVVWPLLRGGRGQETTPESVNLEVYRARREELDEDLAEGSLSREQYDQALAELEQGVLADARPDTPRRGKTGGRPAWAAAAVVAVLLPALGIGLYLPTEGWQSVGGGSPAGGMQASAQRSGGGGSQGQSGMPSLDKAVAALEERLRNQGGTTKEWQLLGRSYVMSERYDKAAEVYRQLYERGGDQKTAVLTGYAEALVLQDTREGVSRADQLLDTALEQSPDDAKGLWYGGLVAFMKADYEQALQRWQHLKTVLPEDADRARINEAIKQAKSGLGKGSEALASAGSAESQQDSGQAAGQGSRQQGGGQESAEGAASIQVQVSLDPSLADKVQDGDTLFIFAKAADGPPMPLAIARRKAGDLPVTVTLDDSMAMMSSMKLSSFEQVVVGARVSKSGSATAKSGDLQGKAGPLASETSEPVEIAIDQVVKEG